MLRLIGCFPSLAAGCVLLSACGGGDSENPDKPEPPVVVSPPSGTITDFYFRDIHGEAGSIAGTLPFLHLGEGQSVDAYLLYALDADKVRLGDALTRVTLTSGNTPSIDATALPEQAEYLQLVPVNSAGEGSGAVTPIHDFDALHSLKGTGGRQENFWVYGEDRPHLVVRRKNDDCIFDNGLVSVIDMQNTFDQAWEESEQDAANTADDIGFPFYQFNCLGITEHNQRPLLFADEQVWQYSAINDAFFYGMQTYDAFLTLLKEPPLKDKIRLRVHYGPLTTMDAYWDGAYANLFDGFGVSYSAATLDIIAHEVAHGVLNRISALNGFETELSEDARTVHEAFADISATMVKRHFLGELQWHQNLESNYRIRELDKIVTESGAIESYLDYDDAGDNFYKRMSTLTYPFYLLSQKWGSEQAYQVYLHAARHCWQPDTTLPMAAACILQSSQALEYARDDVITAFKAVKIKLFDEGVLSHFETEKAKLRVEFSDSSISTGDVVNWQWTFGDGATSEEASPVYRYAEKGEYEVKLTVQDTHGDQDSFIRTVSVTDEYCAIRLSSQPHAKISSLKLNGQALLLEDGKSDYTADVVDIDDELTLEIEGTLYSDFGTSWGAWLDTDDDGVFEDAEVLHQSTAANADGFSLRQTFAIPASSAPLYLRVGGKYALISACGLAVGEGVDLRVHRQE